MRERVYIPEEYRSTKDKYIHRIDEQLRENKTGRYKEKFKVSTLPHRMRWVDTYNEITYVADTAAQSINATWFTLQQSAYGLVWIAGGDQIQGDITELSQIVNEKVNVLIVYGEATQQISKLGSQVDVMLEANDLIDALKIANVVSRPQMTVLFSPSAANKETAAELEKTYVDFLKLMHE